MVMIRHLTAYVGMEWASMGSRSAFNLLGPSHVGTDTQFKQACEWLMRGGPDRKTLPRTENVLVASVAAESSRAKL